MPLVAGVDSSTQSTKVEIRDADTGRLIGAGRGSHPATTPPKSEQDPQSWWSAFIEAFGKALAESGSDRVDAIAIAGQQHGMVALDAGAQVIRPAKLWNDTESADQAKRLVDRLGAEDWALACGSVPVASFTITKLLWLKENEPDSFARLAWVLLPHDWLTFKIAGHGFTDRGDASGTGYFSPAEDRWRPDLLELVDDSADWAARLPKVLGPTESPGKAGPAPGLDVIEGAVVAPGTGDNMAAALGVGLQPGDTVISLGTSGTVYSVASAPTADPTGTVAGFADATGRFLPLVCTLNCTKVTDAFRRILGLDRARFDAAAMESVSGAGGVVLIPYLDGERTPNRPDATGYLSGIRSDVSSSQIARAAVEGVACGLLDGLDALAATGVDVGGGRLMLIGGGARSEAYRQVIADLSGRVVQVPDEEEHVAAGACVQAAAVLTSERPEQVAMQWGLGAGREIEPNREVDREAVRAAYASARG